MNNYIKEMDENMKKFSYTCDRCGKEIRKNVDCTDYDIVLGKCTKKIHCDLCYKCFNDLKEYIKDFIRKEESRKIDEELEKELRENGRYHWERE